MPAADATDQPARATVAAFDVDGTLTSRDAVMPFLRSLRSLPVVGAAFARRPAHTIGSLLRRDRDALKAIALSSLRGLDRDEVWARGERFASDVLPRWLRADTLGRLQWHRDEGHRVVFVSASLRPYLEPFAASLGVEAVLCCELAVADGRLTGAIDGANCRGAEKQRRLERWLAAQGLQRGEVAVWAYGDSAGDRPMLEAADVATWVRRTTIAERPLEVAA
jgi:phosphatidylglycerophosphatase C